MAKQKLPVTQTYPDRGNHFKIDGQRMSIVTQLDSPVIRVIDGVLTPEECLQVIAEGRELLAPALVVANVDEGEVADQARNNSSAGFTDPSPFMQNINRRIHRLAMVKPLFGETIQAQCYQPGQRYLSHNDEYPSPDGPGEDLRFATMVVYLNDVEQGGTTGFTHLGLTVVPKPGRAVYFEYGSDYYHRAIDGGKQPPHYRDLDSRLEHFGSDVEAGEKWIITKWFYVPSNYGK